MWKHCLIKGKIIKTLNGHQFRNGQIEIWPQNGVLYTVVKMNGLDLHVSLDNPQKFKVE